MNVKELKDWLNSLPDKFDDYNVVNGEYGQLDEDDEQFYYRVDKPVTTTAIDQESMELIILNDTDLSKNELELKIQNDKE